MEFLSPELHVDLYLMLGTRSNVANTFVIIPPLSSISLVLLVKSIASAFPKQETTLSET